MPMPPNNTSSTSSNGSLVAASLTLDNNSQQFRVVLSGTYTGVTGTIDVSMDGSTWINWVSVDETVATGGPAVGTLSPSAANKSYIGNCDGWNYVRFIPTAVATGSLVATVSAASSLSFNLPIQLTTSITSFTNITASGTLAVTGATTLSSTLAVSSNATVGGTLGVTGAATFSSTVGITGATTLTGGAVAPDAATIALGTGSDLLLSWDGTRFSFTQAATNSEMRYGVDGAGIDQMWYGDTASTFMNWDQSADSLIFADNAKTVYGTGSDIAVAWDGTRLNVTQGTANSEIRWGVDGAGIDQRFYGDTASASALWDQSADSLIFNGVAGIQNLKVKQSTAVAITGATSIALADSGGIFTVSQAAAYDIDLPSPTTGAGAIYTFSLTAPGANNVTITVTGSAATFVGTIVNDVTSVIAATGSTLTFASGASALGDTIIIRSIATNLYHVQAVTSAAGGITIA